MLKLIFVVVTLLTTAGCRDDVVIDETLPTTTYFAVSDDIGEDHWQHFITVEVNSNEIVTGVEMNSIMQTVMATRRDLAQLADYEEAFGYNFDEQVLTLEAALIGLPRDELADAIEQATGDRVDFDTTTFALLADLALTSEPVETGGYIDGWYQSMSSPDDEGFRYFVNLFIQHGHIIAVHWNAINEEGILKYDPLNATAIDDEAIAWRNQVQVVEKSLIARQDPAFFSFNEAGISTDIPHVTIEVESFVSLVTQALATGPLTRETRGDD